MRTPLFALVLLFAVAPSFGDDEPQLGPTPPPPSVLAKPLPAEVPAAPIKASADTIRLLAASGWSVVEGKGDLLKAAPEEKAASREEALRSGRLVTRALLEKAEFRWHEGRIVYWPSKEPVEDRLLAGIVEGLASMGAASAQDPRKVGRALAAWGIPPAFDGKKILNPDGTPTYYGFMLYQLYSASPFALTHMTTQRLSQALDLFARAHEQAFDKQAPDIAVKLVGSAWSLLTAALPLPPGSNPMTLRPYRDLGEALAARKALLAKEEQAAVAAGDAGRRQDAVRAAAALNALEKQRYHDGLAIRPVPDPARKNAPKPRATDAEDDSPKTPLAASMPVVLRVLERINGKPLTAEQQESLIKSFPMGELVWRMQAQELWRQGLTGKDVRVAVIDTGIGRHPELNAAVKSRQNFTRDRGNALVSPHGTHVAGIIHQLAPDAEIRGYTVFRDRSSQNSLLDGETREDIIAAVHQAVKDGNHLVNMSLSAGDGNLGGDLVRVIEEYSARGVIFVISGGNSRGYAGVNNPSIAPSVLSSGALDVSGRMADFSAYGRNFDPLRLGVAVKRIFLTPGNNVLSTVPGGYDDMSGTSMSAPALTGVSGLLLQSVRSFTPAPDPLSASQRVRDALLGTSRPIPRDLLPPNAPVDQAFVIVDPEAAHQRLKGAVAGR